MAQNDIRNPAGGMDDSRPTTGMASSTGTAVTGGTSSAIGGTVHSDAVRPMGETATLPRIPSEQRGFEEGHASYQPSFSEVKVSERRSRPSSTLVIGSAVAGAIAGGAIPFMLSGRKSRQSEQVAVRHDSLTTAGDADARFTNEGSSPRARR